MADVKQSKQEQKNVQTLAKLGQLGVLIGPVSSEKAVKMLELENTLTFLVVRKATKPQIKKAIEKLFNVKVRNVRTQILNASQKKAYIRLTNDFVASDITSQLGLV